MKKMFLFILIANFVFPICSYAIEEVNLGEHSYLNGVKEKFATTHEIILKTPEWKGTTENPPLILSKAVRIAKEWIKKKNPKFDDFQVTEISIRRVGSSEINNRWYYTIEFQVILDGRALFGSPFTATILMDGTVIEPIIIKKNS